MRRIALTVLVCAALNARPAAAQDKVGVEACDTFLAKYEACIAAKLPPTAQTPQLKDAIKQMRIMWAGLAGDPASKDRVPALCQQALETMKVQIAALGCEW